VVVGGVAMLMTCMYCCCVTHTITPENRWRGDAGNNVFADIAITPATTSTPGGGNVAGRYGLYIDQDAGDIIQASGNLTTTGALAAGAISAGNITTYNGASANTTFVIQSDDQYDGILNFTNTTGTVVGAQLYWDESAADLSISNKIAGANSDILLITGGSEVMRLKGDGGVYIGDTANADMTVGLTINQGANDNEILALKSSDVGHGMTTQAETDTYGTIKKAHPTQAGVILSGFGEVTNGVVLQGYATTDNTTHTAAGRGIIELRTGLKSGTNYGASGANANLLIVRDEGAGATQFIVDAEGDLFANAGTSTTAVTVYDEEDDIGLSRAFDIARARHGAGGLIVDEWDKYATRNEADLVRHGILGDTLANGGLVNVTRLQQLHNGAIWQLNTKHMSLVEEVEALRGDLAIANQKLNALGA
jgi:hypothetical protein